MANKSTLYARRWRAKNPERAKFLSKRWADANRDKARKCSREWYARNSKAERKRGRQRHADDPKARARRKFKLPTAKWAALLSSQGLKCAICASRESLCVDHDHRCCNGNFSCGECVRGFLCRKHNTMLGMAQDSIVVLAAAIDYLRKRG